MMQFKFKTISTADGSANIKSFPNSSNLKSDFGTQNAQQIELIAAVHGPAPISGRLQEGEEATIKVTVDTLNTPPSKFLQKP